MADPTRELSAVVAGRGIFVNGTPLSVLPGHDEYTTLIKHVARTVAQPAGVFVRLTVQDDRGGAVLIVGPRGSAYVETSFAARRRPSPLRRSFGRAVDIGRRRARPLKPQPSR